MFQKLKARITLIASVFVIAGGLPLAIGSSTVHAYDCNSICYDYCAISSTVSECLNAWGGGPRVNTYHDPYTQPNSQFNIFAAGGGNTEIMFLGGTGYQYKCVGDYGNSSSDASAGLDNCPTSGGSAGWGTNFTYTDCVDNGGNYGYGFANNHWSGYLGPQSMTDGVHFYLNKPFLNCLIPVQQIH